MRPVTERGSAPAVQLPLVVLMTAAAALAVGVHLVCFPHYSPDADEAAYLLQARNLAHGHLTLSAAAHGDFFRPWLTGEYRGRLFTKYLPGFPAVLAVSLALVGSAVPALGAIAAGWVFATYAAARELLDSRRASLLGTALTALSPIAVVQSALYLSYALSSALLFGTVAAVLRGVRTRRQRWWWTGGVLAGAAMLTRPLDVVLVVAPLLLLAAARGRREPRRLVRSMGSVALGALPLVGLLLAYDAAVTGSVWRMPLPAVEPLDSFGFGAHRIMPADPLTRYDVRGAVVATARSLLEVHRWSAGGFLLALFAAVGLAIAARRGHRRAETLFLLAVVVAFPTVYFFFWGTEVMSRGLGKVIGPYYYTSAVAALALLAAQGLVAVVRTARARTRGPGRSLAVGTAVLAGAAVVLTTVNMIPVLRFHLGKQDAAEDVLALVPPRTALQTPAVVLVQMPYGSRYVGVTHPYLDNRPTLDGPVLYAASSAARDNHLPEESRGRALYVLRPVESVGPVLAPDRVGVLAPLSVVRGRRLRVTVEGRTARPGRCLTAYVAWGKQHRLQELTCASRPGQVYRTDVVLGPRADLPLPPAGSDVLLLVGVAERAAGTSVEDRREARVSLGTRAGAEPDAVALTPGEPWRLVNFPGTSAWVDNEVSDGLTYRITPDDEAPPAAGAPPRWRR